MTKFTQTYPTNLKYTEWLVLVIVHNASLHDGADGYQTLQKLFKHIQQNIYTRWCRLKLIWADGVYVSIVEKVRKHFEWILEIVWCSNTARSFVVLPRRWVVWSLPLVGWVVRADWRVILNTRPYPVKPLSTLQVFVGS